MKEQNEQKPVIQNIPGTRSRERFAEAEHAQNAKATLKRLCTYFAQEKVLLSAMLAAVLFGYALRRICSQPAKQGN